MKQKINLSIKLFLVLVLTVISSTLFKVNLFASTPNYEFILTKGTSTDVTVPYTGLISEKSDVSLSNVSAYVNNKVTLQVKSNVQNTINHTKIRVTASDNENLQVWFLYQSGQKTDWLNALVSGRFLGEQTGYQIPGKGTLTLDFYILANKIGNYTLTFELVQGTNIIATQQVSFIVGESHSFVATDQVRFPYSGLYTRPTNSSFELPQYVRDQAIGVTLKTDYFSYIKNGLIKVDITNGDASNVQLWAQDNNNNWYDISKIGYWGPSTGFPISTDYDETTTIYVMSNKMGNYEVILSLIDATNYEKVYTSKTYNFSVGPVIKSDTIEEGALDDIITNNNYKPIILYNSNAAMVIYKNFFERLKNSGEQMPFQILNDSENFMYEWLFDGTKIENLTNFNNVNLFIDINNIDKQQQYGESNPLFLNFNHEGALPGIAQIKLGVNDTYMNADNLWLYYLSSSGEVQFAGIPITKNTADGTIQFNIDHCSTYIVTTALIPDAIGNPSTGDINVALFICLGLFSLTGMALTIKKVY